ncbi:MAG: hypothetical protein KY476_20105 [Planctomycetes bacterium]|nr:hypothetical protein [Planctomycetota bacterium]
MTSARQTYQPTAAELAGWEAAVDEEERAIPENRARGRQFFTALREQTLAGQLRRAISASPMRLAEVAEKAGVSPDALKAFMFGDAPLDSDAFGRVAAVLSCELAPAEKSQLHPYREDVHDGSR